LAVAGVIVGLLVLIAIITPAPKNVSTNNSSALVDENLTISDMNATTMNMNAIAPETADEIPEQEAGQGNLTPVQSNAARSAAQYLSMTGFSRDGLIEQLSSDAGDGYSVADATAAVDSLTVDWNENAAKSARQYLNMSGFSCQGLIEQLSSRAGDKYTVQQATYGAHEAGAC
jgi:hypothetical protein